MDTFENIYQQYGEMLYRLAFMYTGNKADSEDILQEVMIKYFSKTIPFFSQEHVKAWLIRVTINQCKNLLSSKNYSNLPLDQDIVVDDQHNKEIDVLQEVYALPFKYKTVILLYYYNDYSIKEIAKMLKTSESNIKMRLKRAREMLKTELEDYHYE